MLFGVPYIDMLKKRPIGQYDKKKKLLKPCAQKAQGTPTTGGVFIIAGTLIMASVITPLLAQK